MTSKQTSIWELDSSLADFHANHIPRPGNEEARKMTVRSGLKCLGLYVNADPILSLVKMLLGSYRWNSTMCYLTWREKVTPANRSLFQLVGKMPDTDEIESGFWLTPSTVQIEPSEDRREKRIAYRASVGRQDVAGCLAEQVATPKLWPTPTQDSVTERTKKYSQGGTPLTMAVKEKMWPTPSATPRGPHTGAIAGSVAEDGKSRISANGTKWGATLETAVKMFPTPRASEWKDVGPVGSKSHTHMDKRDYLCAKVKDPNQPSGTLNPMWVEWLMGYPVGWTDLKDSETQ